MKNLKDYKNISAETRQTVFGPLTVIRTSTGISTHGQIGWEGKTVLANYIYKKDETYDLVYSIIDGDGNPLGHLGEDEGILPTLFTGPDMQPYVSLIPYHPDKEFEVSIPLFNREALELPKGNRPFLGRYAGNARAFSVFHDADIWSDTKPDKLLLIEFKNGVIKKKHNIKIPLPRDNFIFVKNDEIHLVARDGPGYIHRQIDTGGEELRRRNLDFNGMYIRQIIDIGFDRPSLLLGEEEGILYLFKAETGGECSLEKLVDMGTPLFNTWPAVDAGGGIRIISFNNELGNGWLTFEGETLREYFYSRDSTGFREILTGEYLEMHDAGLIISGISRTRERAYSVTLYSLKPKTEQGKEIFILNRTLE